MTPRSILNWKPALWLRKYNPESDLPWVDRSPPVQTYSFDKWCEGTEDADWCALVGIGDADPRYAQQMVDIYGARTLTRADAEALVAYARLTRPNLVVWMLKRIVRKTDRWGEVRKHWRTVTHG